MSDTGLAEGAVALGTFAEDGRAFPAVVHADGRVVDITGDHRSAHAVLDDWDRALPHLGELAGPEHDFADLRPLPPLRHPQILQAGANYRTHVVELIVAQQYDRREGQSIEELRAEATALMDRRAATGTPFLFPGLASAMCGAHDDVVLPHDGEQHDWELELAVVIGRHGRRMPVDRAMELVAGYTVVNDLTVRERFFRTDIGAINVDFTSSKNGPTFLPVGPFVVPAGHVDLDDVRIRLEVNGDVRQDETLDDMIFGVPELVAYASSRVALRPGDLLLTGSPAGNGAHWKQWLKPGDVMDAEITGLGRQRNRCVAEAA